MAASSAVAQVEIPIKLLREQAEQGDARAQYKLGASYARGQGVKKDYVQAMEWYRKAAEQGYAPAEYIIGIIYSKGQGVEQDYKKAVKVVSQSGRARGC